MKLSSQDLDEIEISGGLFVPRIEVTLELLRLSRLGLKYEQMQKDRAAILALAREKKIPVIAVTGIPD